MGICVFGVLKIISGRGELEDFNSTEVIAKLQCMVLDRKRAGNNVFLGHAQRVCSFVAQSIQGDARSFKREDLGAAERVQARC